MSRIRGLPDGARPESGLRFARRSLTRVMTEVCFSENPGFLDCIHLRIEVRWLEALLLTVPVQSQGCGLPDGACPEWGLRCVSPRSRIPEVYPLLIGVRWPGALPMAGGCPLGTMLHDGTHVRQCAREAVVKLR